MTRKILIYKDYGQWISSPLFLDAWLRDHLPKTVDIAFTDATGIIRCGDLDDPAITALVMPGAHSRGYADKLDGIGNDKIRHFIEQGGHYLGFCGGAYYASKRTRFVGENLDFDKENELALFDGLAKGALPEITNGNAFDDSLCSSAAAKLTLQDGRQTAAYYRGGCFFSPHDGCKMEILARYETIEKPAVITLPYGKGHVTLSGVHPEYSSDRLRSQYPTPNDREAPFLPPILETLTSVEENGTADALASLILKDYSNVSDIQASND